MFVRKNKQRHKSTRIWYLLLLSYFCWWWISGYKALHYYAGWNIRKNTPRQAEQQPKK